MKSKASEILKQIVAAVTSMAKSNTLALRRKADAIRTRLIIFSLLQNRKVVMSTLSHRLHNLLAHRHLHRRNGNKKLHNDAADGEDVAEQSEAMVSYNYNSEALVHEPVPVPIQGEFLEGSTVWNGEAGEEDENDKNPDLTHTIFDLEDEADMDNDSGGGSVIELVKNSKEDRGEEFVLEDEIDKMADLFIRRFHRQMKLQKLESFKRYREILERSACEEFKG